MLEVLYQNSLITIRSLNIFLALGFIFAGTFVIRYVNKHKMNLAFVTEYFLHVIIGGLIGGRIVYVLTHLSEFRFNPISVLYVWDLNFNFVGILGASLLVLYYASRRSREDFWAWFDTYFLASLGMLLFVHIGYFFAGKEYGLPTTLPWGIAFEATNIPFTSPLHPTQLYAALLTLILLTYSVNKSKRTHLSGVVGTTALIIYSLSMLGIDFLHGSPSIYVKITYGALAALSFIGYIHCSHKTHITS